MKIDVDGMALKDLKDLRVRVEKAITSHTARAKKSALAQIEETARKFGFSLSELVGRKAGRKRGPVAPKYANPKDREQTWTGRGRKPLWVVDALKSGKKIDDLKI